MKIAVMLGLLASLIPSVKAETSPFERLLELHSGTAVPVRAPEAKAVIRGEKKDSDLDAAGWAKRLHEMSTELEKAASDYADAVKEFLTYDKSTKERGIQIRSFQDRLALLRDSLSKEPDPKKQKKIQSQIRDVESDLDSASGKQAKELQKRDQQKMIFVNRQVEIAVKIQKSNAAFEQAKEELAKIP